MLLFFLLFQFCARKTCPRRIFSVSIKLERFADFILRGSGDNDSQGDSGLMLCVIGSHPGFSTGSRSGEYFLD